MTGQSSCLQRRNTTHVLRKGPGRRRQTTQASVRALFGSRCLQVALGHECTCSGADEAAAGVMAEELWYLHSQQQATHDVNDNIFTPAQQQY